MRSGNRFENLAYTIICHGFRGSRQVFPFVDRLTIPRFGTTVEDGTMVLQSAGKSPNVSHYCDSRTVSHPIHVRGYFVSQRLIVFLPESGSQTLSLLGR